MDYIKELSTSCNTFSNYFYKTLASSTANGQNIASSPFGIHTILSLLSHGANDTTLEELKNALHLSKENIHNNFSNLMQQLNNAEEVELNIANAIYIQKNFDILEEFLIMSKKDFLSEMSSIEFKEKTQAVETINSWIKNKTNNKIQSILQTSDIHELTRVIIVNVIYFKSSWLHPFNPQVTSVRDFHVSKSLIKQVPVMKKEAEFLFGELPNLEATFVEIPYKNQDFAMEIYLPNNIDGLSTLENNINDLSTSNGEQEYLSLYLPTFKFEVTVDLNDILRKMQINTMFEDDADFSKISGMPLKISKVLQKVRIDVSEKGTEAAAAAAAIMRQKRSLLVRQSRDFIVDRPFLFVLRYKPHNIPLFIGRICDLEEAAPLKDEL